MKFFLIAIGRQPRPAIRSLRGRGWREFVAPRRPTLTCINTCRWYSEEQDNNRCLITRSSSRKFFRTGFLSGAFVCADVIDLLQHANVGAEENDRYYAVRNRDIRSIRSTDLFVIIITVNGVREPNKLTNDSFPKRRVP